MKVLFDEDVPAKLMRSLPRHEIHTVVSMQWGGIKNGVLLTLIEQERFDVFLTGDKNIANQQRLEGRPFAVLILSAINWPVIKPHTHKISSRASRSHPTPASIPQTKSNPRRQIDTMEISRANTMPLTFAEFSPVSLVFEIRYPEAYLLWDRAGETAQELRESHEITRFISAEPAKIAFVVEGTKEVTWALTAMSVADHQPKSATYEDFFQLCKDCYEIAVRNFSVTELKRVGFRSTFSKRFDNKEAAVAALLDANLIYIPEGKKFNVNATSRNPEYAVRCEDEKFGYLLRLLVQEIKYEFEPPPQWRGKFVESTNEQRLTLDIDYYSRATIPVGSLSVSEWLSQVSHSIRRDSDLYLIGK